MDYLGVAKSLHVERGRPQLDLSWDPGRVRLAGNMYVVPGEASLAVPSGGRSLWARDEEYRFWIVLGQFI